MSGNVTEVAKDFAAAPIKNASSGDNAAAVTLTRDDLLSSFFRCIISLLYITLS